MSLIGEIIYIALWLGLEALVYFPIWTTALGIIVSVIFFFVKKRKEKSVAAPCVSAVLCGIVLVLSILFYMSHSTYYKYNDWFIMNNDIRNVQKRYGDFDWDHEIIDGERGMVGYYVYTNDGPLSIDPDHLDRYYYIRYDENGKVYEVYVGVQIGG